MKSEEFAVWCGSRSAFGRLHGKKFFTLHTSFFTPYTLMYASWHLHAYDFTFWFTANHTVMNVAWRCDECSVRVWWMLRQGVTNVSPRYKGVCNSVVSRCLPKIQKDNYMNISCLYQSSKTCIFPCKSRLADFYSILAFFRRISMRYFHANSIRSWVHFFNAQTSIATRIQSQIGANSNSNQATP